MSDARLEWFREARFGMFIHWGLYSLLERGEWVMHQEGIPPGDYGRLAARLRPAADCAREWARLACRAGMNYAVLTTKHHDGFCLFDSRLTRYTSARTGGRRDFVREFADACRAEGLRVGLYYSLGDWHCPAYLRVAKGVAAAVPALKRYLHGHIRELMSRYGEIDLLWYDGAWFDGRYLSAGKLDSRGMNALARALQPNLVINDRSGLPEDFSTCENECKPAPRGRDWEMCTCINDIWGYARHDHNYKTVNQLIFMLVNCATQGGNLLLNIGPRADGSVPEEQVRRLEAVGRWLRVHGESVYGTERLPGAFVGPGRLTRKGRRLYVHAFYWPGRVMRLPGMDGAVPGWGVGRRVPRVTVLTTGARATARWKGRVLEIGRLPEEPPDRADTVVALDFPE